MITIPKETRGQNEPSWSLAQRERLQRFLDKQAANPTTTWVGYWCSNQWGQSANGGSGLQAAAPWVTHEVAGPLEPCSPRALHATLEPHRWKGCRVWVVALVGDREDCPDNKSAALRREIIGEVLPADVICHSIAARMNLSGADLSWANLSGANLSRADLSWANLYGADLSWANLSGANLYGANLSLANLYRANLYRANLYEANLSLANLSGANLSGADLSWANLSGANLSRADLSWADLYGANLYRANLSLAKRPDWLPEQWIVTDQGFIARREG